MMKPFKLKEYLKNPNLRVVTREGKSVEILCTNLISDRPVVAKITELGFSLAYDVYGSHTSYQSPNDLFFVTEENKRWINLYRIDSGSDAYAGGLFKTKEEAEMSGRKQEDYIATFELAWEDYQYDDKD